MRVLVHGRNHFIGGALVLATFGVIYLVSTIVVGIPEARALWARVGMRRDAVD
jgi:hypothetical protein